MGSRSTRNGRPDGTGWADGLLLKPAGSSRLAHVRGLKSAGAFGGRALLCAGIHMATLDRVALGLVMAFTRLEKDAARLAQASAEAWQAGKSRAQSCAAAHKEDLEQETELFQEEQEDLRIAWCVRAEEHEWWSDSS